MHGQSQPILQPLSLSPSRTIKIMFNQVSKENPFASFDKHLSQEASHNSAVDSDESLGRCQDLLDNAFSPTRPGNQTTTVDFDKVVNATPAGRSIKETQGRSSKKLFSGVQRYSDSLQPYNMLQEQQAHEREQQRFGSPFKGMTEFQQVLMARSTSPQKAGAGLQMPVQVQRYFAERERSRSRTNSREPRRSGSPGRRGQAPSQLKKALQVAPQPGVPQPDAGPFVDPTVDATGTSFFPDLAANEADYLKNRLRN